MIATCVEPEASRRREPDHHHHDLVLAQHQRRQPVAGLQAIPAADATLALDRDSELLEVVDVAPDRAAVDAKSIRDLTAAGNRPGLEKLEDLEQSGGGGRHSLQYSTNRGRKAPYSRGSVYRDHFDDPTRREDGMSETASIGSTARDFDFLMGS